MNAPEKLKYDRSTQDVGNIVHLEHFNCCIDDQRLAILFYVVGLGATRDRYLFTGPEDVWRHFGVTPAAPRCRPGAPGSHQRPSPCAAPRASSCRTSPTWRSASSTRARR